MRDLTLRLVIDDSQKTKLAGIASAAARAQADIDRVLTPSSLLRMETAANRFGQAVSRGSTVALTAMTLQVGALTSAMSKLGREFISVNEKFGGLQITLGSALRSLSAARSITAEIARLTANSPLPFQNIASVAQSFSVIPATSVRLLQDIQQKRLGTENSFLRKALQTVEAMTTFRPDQDADSAIFAIREALGGQTRSLVRRFDIPSTALSTASGNSMDKLKRNPELMFEAINKFFTNIISPDAVLQFARQPSKLMDNLIEQVFEIPLLKIGSAKFRQMGEKLTEDMYMSPYETMLTRAKDYYEELVQFMNTTFESSFLEPLRRSFMSAISRGGDALKGAAATLLDRTGVPGQGLGVERVATAGVMGFNYLLDKMVSVIEFLTRADIISALVKLQEGLMSFAEILFKGFTFLSNINPVLAPIAAIAAPYVLNNLGTILRAVGHDLPMSLSKLGMSLASTIGIVKPATAEWSKVGKDLRDAFSGMNPSALFSTRRGRNDLGQFINLGKEQYVSAFSSNPRTMAFAEKLIPSRFIYGSDNYNNALRDIALQQYANDRRAFMSGERGITRAFANNPTGMDYIGMGSGTLAFNGADLSVNRQPGLASRAWSGLKGAGAAAGTALLAGGTIAALTGALYASYEVITANTNAISANTAALNEMKADAIKGALDSQTRSFGRDILGLTDEQMNKMYQPTISKQIEGLGSLTEFVKMAQRDASGNISGGKGMSVWERISNWFNGGSTALSVAGLNPANAKTIIDAALEAGIIKKETYDAATAAMTEKKLQNLNASTVAIDGYAPAPDWQEVVIDTPEKALAIVVKAMTGQSPEKLASLLADANKGVVTNPRKDMFGMAQSRFSDRELELLMPFQSGLRSAQDPKSIAGWLDEMSKMDKGRQLLGFIESITKSTLVTDSQQLLKSEEMQMDPLKDTVESLSALKKDAAKVADAVQGLDKAIVMSFEEKTKLFDQLRATVEKLPASELKTKMQVSMQRMLRDANPYSPANLLEMSLGSGMGPLTSLGGGRRDWVSEVTGGMNKPLVLQDSRILFQREMEVLRESARAKLAELQKAIPEVVAASFTTSIDATLKAAREGKLDVAETNIGRVNDLLGSAGIKQKLALPPRILEKGSVPETDYLKSVADFNNWSLSAIDLLDLVAQVSKSEPGKMAAMRRRAEQLREERMAPAEYQLAQLGEFRSAYDPASGRVSRGASGSALNMLEDARIQGADDTTLVKRRLFQNSYGADELSANTRQLQALRAEQEKVAEAMSKTGIQQDALNRLNEESISISEHMRQAEMDRQALMYQHDPRAFFDAFADSARGAARAASNFASMGRNVADTLTSSLGNAFGDIVTNTKSVSEAFRNMARDILSSIARMLANQAAAQLIGMFFTSFLPGAIGAGANNFAGTSAATSGPITGSSASFNLSGGYMAPPSGFSSGGSVMGGSGVRDDIPALLMGGEFVLNKRAAMAIGHDRLQQWNDGGYMKFADGGVVPSRYATSPATVDAGSGAMPTKSVTINITVHKDGSKTADVQADDTKDTELMTGLARQMEAMIDEKLQQQQRIGGTLNPTRR